EHGPAILHLDRLIQWARVLCIPETYLWFKLPNSSDAVSSMLLRRTVGVGTHRLLAIPPPVRTLDPEDDPMRRRKLFTTLPTAAAAGLVGLAGIESLRHHLIAARAGDPAEVDDWEA